MTRETVLKEISDVLDGAFGIKNINESDTFDDYAFDSFDSADFQLLIQKQLKIKFSEEEENLFSTERTVKEVVNFIYNKLMLQDGR